MMTWSELVGLLNGTVSEHFDRQPAYNIAPTMVVVTALPGRDGYALGTMVWGLQPEWARSYLINAQAEKYVAPGRHFWTQFRRCLIPASGFYEWQKAEDGVKQPMYIRSADGRPMVFAGLYQAAAETSARSGGERCVIVTTKPNSLMEPIHNRMPAILRAEHYETWLDPHVPPTACSIALQPYPAELLAAHPVNTRVNDVRNNDPRLVEPD